ncbi:MAG TPA: dicarboxylate/amino acid:cation symporter [Gemmatimonadales bacterium]|nr:dicarboxylate/amino acid:cation symporter [Gemmatimonadales bacterium]
MAGNEPRRRVALHTKILLALVLGAAAGVASNIYAGDSATLSWVTDNVAQPVGQIFLRLLFMVVVPLVFASVTLGVASLGDLRRIGRVGTKTLLIFLATTAVAVVVGLLLVNLIRPGESLDPAIRTALMAEYSSEAGEKVVLSEENRFGINTLVNIVPRNPVAAAANGDMLGLIFFSLIFGIALTLIAKESAAPVMRVLEGVAQAVMVIIGFAMRLAPLGVAGLIFSVTAKFGFDILKSLGLYVVTVLLALALHQFGVLGAIARFVAGIDIRSFYSRAKALMITAFSTSSSNATLPTTIRTAEENFGVPREIAGFVLPLGATMNMNGTAMFEGVTVLFLAQVFGVQLDLFTQLIVIIMCVITAVGVAGVPSGSIPLLVMVLGMVGVPGEGIALILGVDRILDMARTVPNVTADLLTSLLVAKSERLPLVVPARQENAA